MTARVACHPLSSIDSELEIKPLSTENQVLLEVFPKKPSPTGKNHVQNMHVSNASTETIQMAGCEGAIDRHVFETTARKHRKNIPEKTSDNSSIDLKCSSN
jgi:hypothetical protein